MTDQKPTGVFVRLPNDAADPQWAKAYDAVVGDEGTKKAALWDFIQIAKAIGTPVTGGELEVVGMRTRDIRSISTSIWHYSGDIESSGNYETELLVLQSDAQAQIAARDTEIVRLQEALELIANSDNIDNCLDPGRNKRVAVHTLKGGAA